MSILFVLVPVTLALVAVAAWALFWAVDNGQFDDLDRPAWDAIRDDEVAPRPSRSTDAVREDD
jgi:cbb3-type cytochrome oxidase maturation protein